MMKLSTAVFLAALTLTSCASSSSQRRDLTKDERAQMYMELATSDLNEGDPTGALVYLRKSEEINSKSAELHYLFAITYFRKNEISLATRSAQKALQLKPDFSAAKNTLGKLLMDQGKMVEAEKYLKEAAGDLTYRESFIAKTNLGILYYKRLNHAEAERWLSKALLDGGDAACIAAYYRGMIYFDTNQLAKANSDFTTSSKQACSQFSDAHLAMGKTYLRMKKYDQARAKLLEIQQLFPTSDAAVKASDYLKEIP